jgi:tellurite resistance protein
MTHAHTPGEWHTNSGQVYSLDETRGATIALVSDHHGPDVQQANARLIAAAPDLLAALKSIAAILNLPVQYTSSQSADQDVAQVLILRTDSRVARNVARAAIAAATGAGE